MKPNGRIENWRVFDPPRFVEAEKEIKGAIFDNDLGGFIIDGQEFNFYCLTEPPYFKSRIVRSTTGRFYLLGEPANKEFDLV